MVISDELRRFHYHLNNVRKTKKKNKNQNSNHMHFKGTCVFLCDNNHLERIKKKTLTNKKFIACTQWTFNYLGDKKTAE